MRSVSLLTLLLVACRAAPPVDSAASSSTATTTETLTQTATDTSSSTATETSTATATDTSTDTGTPTATSTDTATATSTGTGTGGIDAPPDGFLATFPFSGGCGDVVFYARSDDDALGLIVYIAGLATDAATAGTTQEWVFPLDVPDPDVRVEVRQGVRVSDIVCDDVAEIDSRVDVRWTAVGGQAGVRITPAPSGGWHTGTGTLTLSDVTFARDDDPSQVVSGGDLEIADVFVGWLAG